MSVTFLGWVAYCDNCVTRHDGGFCRTAKEARDEALESGWIVGKAQTVCKECIERAPTLRRRWNRE